MNETLGNLQTLRISAFFKYVRENCDTLPTDGALKKILRSKASEYSKKGKVLELPSDSSQEYLDDEWLANFWAGLKLVQMGKMTSEAVKKDLGIA